MKEKLYTIPLNDAMNVEDECPLCYIENKVNQDLLDFVLGSGSSYMEADIRDMTDRAGFCREHFKKMFDYGNTLGNAWILKTHLMRMNKQYSEEVKHFRPGKKSLGDMFSKKAESSNSMVNWLEEKRNSCYFCNRFEEEYARYLDTFVYLFENDPEFVSKVKSSKGFCLMHFEDLLKKADSTMSAAAARDFYEIVLPLMESNMQRIFEDVSWMVDKFDYRNKDADWKNSKDSIQRGMQKLKGGYPADAPYKYKK